MVAELGEVSVRGARPSGWSAEPDDVDGRFEQLGRDAGREQGEGGGVGRDEVPEAVDDHGRVGLVTGEDHVEGRPHGVHRAVVERALAVDGRVAGGHQQRVAFPQRHVEVLGQVQHQLAARLERPVSTKLRWRVDTAASLDEVELAEAAALSPAAQQVADPERRGDGAHAIDRTDPPAPGRLPGR